MISKQVDTNMTHNEHQSSTAGMTPLQHASTDMLSRVDGLAFDVDDTLTTRGKLSQVAYDSLWKLNRAGFRLVAVTGRPLGWAELFSMQWPIHAAVSENGAVWAWQGADHAMHRGFFDTKNAGALPARREVLRQAVATNMPWIRESRDSWARVCDLAFDIAEFERVSEKDITALRALLEEHGAHLSQSSVHLHATFTKHDKARGTVRAVQEVLGETIDPSKGRWAFVGDSGNDEAAFAYFSPSFGVANVRHHLAKLKSTPMYVTHAPYGDGFAELAQRLIDAKRGRNEPAKTGSL